MGSPAIPDPMFDQTSATTLTEFSRRKGSNRKGSKKPITGKAGKHNSLKSLVGKKLSKRRPK